MPDTTTGLRLRYDLSDLSDSTIIDSGPSSLNLAVTSSGGFPTRSTADGKPARLFSRAAGATPNNYATAAMSSALAQALAGANNGNNGEFTIALWWRRTATGAGVTTGNDHLFNLEGAFTDSVSGPVFGLRQSRSTSVFAIQLGRTPTTIDTATFSTYSPGTSLDGIWTHVAVVCRANVAGVSYFYDLYINGTKVETSASKLASWFQSGTYFNTAVNISITNTSGSGQVGGYLREIRAYNRALTSGDVTALTTLNFFDPTAIAQSVGFGEPRLAPAAAFKTPVAVDYDAENLSSSAPVAAASSKSKAVIG